MADPMAAARRPVQVLNLFRKIARMTIWVMKLRLVHSGPRKLKDMPPVNGACWRMASAGASRDIFFTLFRVPRQAEEHGDGDGHQKKHGVDMCGKSWE